VVGRNEAKSAEAAAELKQGGARAIAVTADVTDKEAVAAMAGRVAAELGRIDILINNAGINIRKPPHALDIAEWNSVITTNLTSAFLCSQAVYPAMKAAGGGKIINIGSMMSIFGASFAPAYAASKGGIVQFTRHGRGWPRQYPGQRRAAGLDRHGAHAAGAPADRRPARERAAAHAGEAVGHRAGHGRRGGLSRQLRVRLRHGRRSADGGYSTG
jgi:hypothetical protein